ncbi:MAG: hypothetical protein Q7U47_00950 [Paludibacter sp.]|nr:hypothetical protein [Paludibacter sp.]
MVTGTSFSATNAEDIITLKDSPTGSILNFYAFDVANRLADKAVDLTADKDGNYYICGTTRLTAFNGYALIKTSNQLVRKWARVESPEYGSASTKVSFNPVCQQIEVAGYHTDWYNKYLIGTVVYDSAGIKKWRRSYRTVATDRQ